MSANTLSSFSTFELTNRASQKGLSPDEYLAQLLALEANLQPVSLRSKGNNYEIATYLRNNGANIPEEHYSYNALPPLSRSTDTVTSGHIANSLRIMLKAANCDELIVDKQTYRASNTSDIGRLAHRISCGLCPGFLSMASIT